MSPNYIYLGNRALSAEDPKKALEYYRLVEQNYPDLAPFIKANIARAERMRRAKPSNKNRVDFSSVEEQKVYKSENAQSISKSSKEVITSGLASAGLVTQPPAAFEYFGEHVSAHRGGPPIVIPEHEAIDLRFKGTVGVHLHLFHLDQAFQLRFWLSQIEVPFDLFISICDENIHANVRASFAGLPGCERLIIEALTNRGRDLRPMVVEFGARLAAYEFVLHLHTKKSDHTSAKKDWGTQLGHHLLHSASHVRQVLNIFADNPVVGLIFPVYHPCVGEQIKWGANLKRCASEIHRILHCKISEKDLLPFPAGSFFFARTKAIFPLLHNAFEVQDFEHEQGQIDGTLSHAIERMFSLVSAHRGFTFRQVRAEKPHSLSCSYFKKWGNYESPVLRRLSEGKLTAVPSEAHPALSSLRILFFTCSSGGYDNPLPFEHVLDGVDYVFFTDQVDEPRKAQWNLRELAFETPEKIKTARRYKTQIHRIYQEYDIAVWVDGNIAIRDSVVPLILRVLSSDANFGIIQHPYRSSISDELEALVKNKIDHPEILRNQLAGYIREGFVDDVGLTETNFLIMDLRRKETTKALDIWWAEIQEKSRRDQMSFDYACWKAGAKKVGLLETGLSVRADPRFVYFEHGLQSHNHLQLVKYAHSHLFYGPHNWNNQLPKKITVDVVICVHNSPDDVARCLRSVSLALDGRTRVVVVDDGSEAPTRRVISDELRRIDNSLLIRNEHALGYTKAANVGIRVSTADYVILLNSDTIVPNDWVGRLVEAAESDQLIGVVGPLSNSASWQSVPAVKNDSGDYAVNSLPQGISVNRAAELCQRIPAVPFYETPVINGFCFAIKRRVIDEIGLFDEQAFPRGYGEENDYCLRLKKVGLKCGVTFSTYVFHSKSKSFSHENRRVLSKFGWEALTKKHGKETLGKVLKDLEDHQELHRARKWFSALISRNQSPVLPIAFYLPQFHRIPINDRAWGAGFSEWRNVVKARPRYKGHIQPKLPADLGYYDLTVPATLTEQARLANEYGIATMAVYYYRFGRKRIMEGVTSTLMSHPEIPMSFFYCWANEDWTRAWDGATNEIILKQDYKTETIELFIKDLIEAFADPRYLRINDRPVFMIYQLDKLEGQAKALEFLRNEIRNRLSVEVYVGTTWNDRFEERWEAAVDFIAQFPPHRTPRVSKRELIPTNKIDGALLTDGDYYEAYSQSVRQSLESLNQYSKLAPGVCPDWDNSARRLKKANILVGSSPIKFQEWVSKAGKATIKKFEAKEIPAPMLFINAWNEWAEGAFLEPSEEFGNGYLEAFRRGIDMSATILTLINSSNENKT